MLYFRSFTNFNKAEQKQLVTSVISCMAFDYVVTDVHASLGDSRLNSGRIIRLFVLPESFCALLYRI